MLFDVSAYQGLCNDAHVSRIQDKARPLRVSQVMTDCSLWNVMSPVKKFPPYDKS